jgi:hypothetical protein
MSLAHVAKKTAGLSLASGPSCCSRAPARHRPGRGGRYQKIDAANQRAGRSRCRFGRASSDLGFQFSSTPFITCYCLLFWQIEPPPPSRTPSYPEPAISEDKSRPPELFGSMSLNCIACSLFEASKGERGSSCSLNWWLPFRLDRSLRSARLWP